MSILKAIRIIPKGVCTLLTTALILWLTLAPHPVGDLDVPLFPGIDKVVHAIMFGWLTLMLCLDINKFTDKTPSVRAVWMSAIAASLSGIGIEWLQNATELGRSFELADIGADCGGALLAAIIALKLRRLL